jgi:phosphoadenosine phosphosulfate reductase
MNTAQRLAALPQLDSTTPAEEIYRIGRDMVHGPVVMACSFSVEDVALIDLLHDVRHSFSIFAIDSGRLNEETYEVAEHVRQRYGVSIDWYFPSREAVEQLERAKGLFSFRDSLADRHECCHIRKVEPLQRALKGAAAWITGMRRGQGVTRSEQQPLEVDPLNGGLLKINPLTFWDDEQLWDYARQQRLPLNRLYQQGYASIGCAPCTRAIEAGEESRSGRWWWEDPEHSECGLHRR